MGQSSYPGQKTGMFVISSYCRMALWTFEPDLGDRSFSFSAKSLRLGQPGLLRISCISAEEGKML